MHLLGLSVMKLIRVTFASSSNISVNGEAEFEVYPSDMDANGNVLSAAQDWATKAGIRVLTYDQLGNTESHGIDVL